MTKGFSAKSRLYSWLDSRGVVTLTNDGRNNNQACIRDPASHQLQGVHNGLDLGGQVHQNVGINRDEHGRV